MISFDNMLKLFVFDSVPPYFACPGLNLSSICGGFVAYLNDDWSFLVGRVGLHCNFIVQVSSGKAAAVTPFTSHD